MDIISGRNAVTAALDSKLKINKILIERSRNENQIITHANKKGISIEFAGKEELNKTYGGTEHQGVIALAEPFQYLSIHELLEISGTAPFFIILDHIVDPHNFGAILRSAEGAGVTGVIIPSKRAAAVTKGVYRASAGAVCYVPVAKVANIANTIDLLKKSGLWIYGADISGTSVYSENLTGSVGVVIGSEAGGVSNLVKKKCDALISIPMLGRISSLNASVSAGIIIYEILRQRIKENEKS